ncbi:Bud site selection protein bud4, partial [Elasticomyces elasticus]
TIDFYADNRQDKEGWMAALCECVGKEDAKGKRASWTDLVLARERATAKAAAKCSAEKSTVVDDAADDNKPERAAVSRASTNASTIRAASKSVPNSPIKGDGLNAGRGAAAGPVGQRKNSDAPLPPTPSGRLADTPPMGQRKGGRERAAVRSMIF